MTTVATRAQDEALETTKSKENLQSSYHQMESECKELRAALDSQAVQTELAKEKRSKSQKSLLQMERAKDELQVRNTIATTFA